MMKRGRLTEAEKYFIDKMVDDNIDVNEMAHKLERSVNVVKGYLETMVKAHAKKSESKERPENYFVNRTVGNKPGVSIMTEAASMNGDVKKPTGTTSVIEKSCFKIFPDGRKKKK